MLVEKLLDKKGSGGSQYSNIPKTNTSSRYYEQGCNFPFHKTFSFQLFNPSIIFASLPPYPNSKSSFKVILVDVVSDVFPHALLFGR